MFLDGWCGMANFTLPKSVERQLHEEPIIWLATVRHDGQPQVVPVWFLWDGTHVLIYSLPVSQKVRNIQANPRVSLHFNSDRWATQVTRLDGYAELVRAPTPAHEVAAYLAKYQEGMARLGMTPEEFTLRYSALIRVRPERLIYW